MFQDWNTFLLRFNELDFCISENETLKHGPNESTTPESTVTSSQSRTSTQAPLLLEDPGPINISVTITLTLDPLKPFGGYSRNITHLYSTVMGHQVGLAGKCVETPVLLLPLLVFHSPVNTVFWNGDATMPRLLVFLGNVIMENGNVRRLTFLLQDAVNQKLASIPACLLATSRIVWA